MRSFIESQHREYPQQPICTLHDSITVGRNVKVGDYCVIEKDCVIGDDTIIGNSTVLRPGTKIGSKCIIGHLTVFEGECEVGNNVLIHAQCHITKGVVIEDFVFIAPLFVGANDPRMCHARRHIIEYKETPYRICRGARIGIGVSVLPGVTIGANSVVAVGSVVTRDIPDGKIVKGVPAEVCGQVPPEEWL